MIGVRHLVKSPIGRELDAAIICEPEENELCLEQRGVVWARFRARGKMAHGAMPEAGINPDLRASASSSARRPALERRLRRVCERSRHLTPAHGDADDHPGARREGSACRSRTSSRPLAELVLDVRLTPGIDADGIQAELEALCRKAEGACPG